jgi:Protein of unknown function (DUF2934)
MPEEPISTQLRNVPIDAHPNLEEEIRRRAFEMYEERGRQDGHDIEDWVRAEAEVISAAVRTRAA